MRLFNFFIVFSLLVISTHAHALCALTDDPVFDVDPAVTVIRTNELEVSVKIDPPIGINPLDVNFTAKILKGKAQSFLWDFGDSSTCAGQNCTHTFEDPGSYIVRLIISGESSKPVVKKVAVFVKEKGKKKY
ncbi:MAG: PKD domain-containing protein [Thermodesulfovibrionales bacterium]|nr:PKD domain-containing protein [Thermodesulfovibrionales bacterium]